MKPVVSTMMGAVADGRLALMPLSLWSVLVAAVVAFSIGVVWHSPLLFASARAKEMGHNPDDKSTKAKMEKMKKNMSKIFTLTFVTILLSAFVLGQVIELTRANSAINGAFVGFAVWLGFVTTVQLTSHLFSGQSTRLYLINTGHQLVCYLAMGAILAAWPR